MMGKKSRHNNNKKHDMNNSSNNKSHRNGKSKNSNKHGRKKEELVKPGSQSQSNDPQTLNNLKPQIKT